MLHFIALFLYRIFVTQTNTSTMVKHVPEEQMFDIKHVFLENHFHPPSVFVMLMLVGDVLNSYFL